MNIYPENVLVLSRDLAAIEQLICDVTAELNRRGHTHVFGRIANYQLRENGEWETFSALFKFGGWTTRAYPAADFRYVADLIVEKSGL